MVLSVKFLWLKVKKAQSKWIFLKRGFIGFHNWQVQCGDWLNCCFTQVLQKHLQDWVSPHFSLSYTCRLHSYMESPLMKCLQISVITGLVILIPLNSLGLRESNVLHTASVLILGTRSEICMHQKVERPVLAERQV